MDLTYDKYIVGFSGGKDSTACFLHLLESGVPKEKIELWHHCVDGKDETFMDWEITEDYCRKFAAAFGVPIYFSWRDGGFLKEMLLKMAVTRTISSTSDIGSKMILMKNRVKTGATNYYNCKMESYD